MSVTFFVCVALSKSKYHDRLSHSPSSTKTFIIPYNGYELEYSVLSNLYVMIKNVKYEAQTALFKDQVRTAQ